jgi:hypothetical protein
MSTAAARAAHLIEAAALIERDGLHKGDYWPGYSEQAHYQPGMPCCSMGAIAVTSDATLPAGEFNPEEVIPAAADLSRYINRGRPSGLARWLHDWNDEEARTAVHVAEAMRGCAAELRRVCG